MKSVKNIFKKIRSIGTFWMAKRTMEHLENIRKHELNLVIEMLPPGAKLLEIGAGSGWQAKELEEKGFVVSAIDIPSSNYRENRIWNVTEYDGENVPFQDDTFDVIFSSNVFEHIPHVYDFQKEMHRVLKPDGIMLHLMPSSSWRFWTNITHVLRLWTIPKVHGEHASNSIQEIRYFRREWWAEMFNKTGWKIEKLDTNGLFYTGCSIMDSRLSMETRTRLSRYLGSACNIFIARKP